MRSFRRNGLLSNWHNYGKQSSQNHEISLRQINELRRHMLINKWRECSCCKVESPSSHTKLQCFYGRSRLVQPNAGVL